jgi:DNA modification methylase
MFKILNGDCRKVLHDLSDNSIDAIVTDPPYELGFMGKAWDSTGIAYNTEVWAQCLRVLKPGGHLLAFGGSRTYHRLAVAIEDAGFQIRDQIMWVYGSGFPKSLNVSKAIDKMANAEREVIGVGSSGKSRNVLMVNNTFGGEYEITASATDEAKQWEGWGTALKPAHEPIVLARKPLTGTVAETVLEHGTGALNIDGCRVDYVSEDDKNLAHYNALGMDRLKRDYGIELGSFEGGWKKKSPTLPTGRFPANFIHDGSDEVLELFPQSNGGAYPSKRGQAVNTTFASGQETEGGFRKMGDSGSAARFFYCAKANKRDRNEGLDGFEQKQTLGGGGLTAELREDGSYETASAGGKFGSIKAKQQNNHPTVKPTNLMRYLCRLITPPNGTILDPFAGSGSTGKAAILEGFNFVGIEQSAEYVEIATARIKHAKDNL